MPMNKTISILLLALFSTFWSCHNWKNEGKRTSELSHAVKMEDAEEGNQQSATDELVCPRFSRKHVPSQMLSRTAYTTSYNHETLTSNWVGWVLTGKHTDGTFARKGHMFIEDTDVPRPRAIYSDIRESECGYQRGHICPAGDNKWSKDALDDAFLMTNICPQDGDLNQRDWKYLEEACREWAQQYGKVYIVAGPIYQSSPYHTVGEHHVAVPDSFFKVVLRKGNSLDDLEAIGFIYPNQSGHKKMEAYVQTVDEVERATGLDFFYQLDDEVENRIESHSDLGDW